MPRRRQITITAHWTLGLMLVMLISRAEWPWMCWLFGGTALTMGMLAVTHGLMHRPGLKLTGFFRAVHLWWHRLLYTLLAWVGLTTLHARIGNGLTPLVLFQWYLILAAAVMVHAIFHLRRHTALNDGALRLITPPFVHKYL